jgi:hypothetical protein
VRLGKHDAMVAYLLEITRAGAAEHVARFPLGETA